MRPFALIAWAAGVVIAGLLLPRAAATPPRTIDPARPALAAAPAVPPASALPAVAAAPATGAMPPVAATPARAIPGRAGMVVGIDPETGQLGMPTAAQMVELSPREQAMVSRSGAGLTEVRHADGTVSVNLQGRFQELVVVRFGADGKPVYGCYDDPRAARRALATPPAPIAEEK